MKKSDGNITVGFVALGCPKNIVDSEVMLARIGQAGMIISHDIDNADVVVINTCGFIEPARQEAFDAVKQALADKRKGRVRSVIVAGCLSERMGARLAEELPGIDAVVGLGSRDNIAQIIEKSLARQDNREKSPAGRKKTGDGKKTDPCGIYIDSYSGIIHNDSGRMLITPRHWAYLRISEGCNRRCSFCTIPSIRGRLKSKPMEDILTEAMELVANGAVELSIIAQDITRYGTDLHEGNNLSSLIRELDKIDGLRWIRLMYLYPSAIDDKLIATIAASGKVVHYIDMPIQHINDTVLKRMRRGDKKQHTIALIEKLRAAIPDVVLRTTVIVGFAGETKQQFSELMDFIKWAGFDALGCFKFYPEHGTAAAKLDGQISPQLKQQRFDELMLTQQEIAFEKNRRLAGRHIECLVDQRSTGKNGIGRYYGQAPHIDGVCHIRKCRAAAGEFIKAKITSAKDYDLVVDQL